MSRQLVLEFAKLPAALGAADFLVTDCNRRAAEWLERWPDWPAPALTISGPSGSGKTHLSRVFMQRSGAVDIAAVQLARDTLPVALGEKAAAVVDDAHRADPLALLHLFNLLGERRGHLLLTAAAPPAAWATTPPDLRSRLLAAPQAALEPPDDSLLAALLVKLFADRQLRVGKEVVLYCVRHMERSHEAARRLVAALDRRVFESRHDITLPAVRATLAALQDG